MSAGDLWQVPSGRKGLELPGSSRDWLRLALIVDGWPYPAPPAMYARSLCTPMVSRYHGAGRA